jgi:hypothetical protein
VKNFLGKTVEGQCDLLFPITNSPPPEVPPLQHNKSPERYHILLFLSTPVASDIRSALGVVGMLEKSRIKIF